ncbi:hypothetical protein D9757_015204 [Collybiopsis confluens]|uniref:Retrotransposon gag domain-containing protein n=1 Tax=Collybiopsis confluens TaxID=2823264 RepID=A0A8H5GIT8_9AGAR|nr:hypothetical protein D9757_015204 [Collybiopsis confluens]
MSHPSDFGLSSTSSQPQDPEGPPTWSDHGAISGKYAVAPNVDDIATLTFESFRYSESVELYEFSSTSPSPKPTSPPPPQTHFAQSAPAPATPKPPTFNAPLPFKGKSSEVEVFINKVIDAVKLQGTSLPTEKMKCMYMATFFGDGGPTQWYYSVRLSNPQLLTSFPDFIDTFCNHFGDSNLAYNAKNKLESMVQTGSAAAYASAFRELLVHVNWTDESKIDTFYKGLKTATKDMISNLERKKRPKVWDDYVTFAIDCDNRAHKRNVERKDEIKPSSKLSKNSNNNLSSFSYNHSTPTPSSSNTLPPDSCSSKFVSAASPDMFVSDKPDVKVINSRRFIRQSKGCRVAYLCYYDSHSPLTRSKLGQVPPYQIYKAFSAAW